MAYIRKEEILDRADPRVSINDFDHNANESYNREELALTNAAKAVAQTFNIDGDENDMYALADFIPGHKVKLTAGKKIYELKALPPSDAANWEFLGYYDADLIANHMIDDEVESSVLKVRSVDGMNAAIEASEGALKLYVDGLLVGLLDDRGGWDASENLFPNANGSGEEGAILKGDIYFIEVPGGLGDKLVNVGDSVRAIVDDPGQTPANWAILGSNLTYVPENRANKSTDPSFAADSDELYPSQKAVRTALLGKASANQDHHISATVPNDGFPGYWVAGTVYAPVTTGAGYPVNGILYSMRNALVIVQYLIETVNASTQKPRMYIRQTNHYASGAFSAWSEMWNDQNFNPASKLDATATAADSAKVGGKSLATLESERAAAIAALGATKLNNDATAANSYQIGGKTLSTLEDERQAAIDAAVAAAIDALIAGAPGALNTLNEIAAAINDDDNFAAGVTTALAGKLGVGDNAVSASKIIPLATNFADGATAPSAYPVGLSIFYSDNPSTQFCGQYAIVTTTKIGNDKIVQVAHNISSAVTYYRKANGAGTGWLAWQESLSAANVVNNVTTTTAGFVLDGRIGKVLNDAINTLAGVVAGKLNTADATNWQKHKITDDFGNTKSYYDVDSENFNDFDIYFTNAATFNGTWTLYGLCRNSPFGNESALGFGTSWKLDNQFWSSSSSFCIQTATLLGFTDGMWAETIDSYYGPRVFVRIINTIDNLIYPWRDISQPLEVATNYTDFDTLVLEHKYYIGRMSVMSNRPAGFTEDDAYEAYLEVTKFNNDASIRQILTTGEVLGGDMWVRIYNGDEERWTSWKKITQSSSRVITDGQTTNLYDLEIFSGAESGKFFLDQDVGSMANKPDGLGGGEGVAILTYERILMPGEEVCYVYMLTSFASKETYTNVYRGSSLGWGGWNRLDNE